MIQLHNTAAEMLTGHPFQLRDAHEEGSGNFFKGKGFVKVLAQVFGKAKIKAAGRIACMCGKQAKDQMIQQGGSAGLLQSAQGCGNQKLKNVVQRFGAGNDCRGRNIILQKLRDVPNSGSRVYVQS